MVNGNYFQQVSDPDVFVLGSNRTYRSNRAFANIVIR